jgi:hypothetical protein
MSTSRILSECPYIQAPLGELFREVGQREQLPFLEYILSPENSALIKTEVSPGRGKTRTVEARWIQRLPESEVQEGVDPLACTATNVYGDSTQTYTLDDTDNFGWEQLITASEIKRHCQENSRYILESVMRGMDVIERKVATAAAIQTAAQIGKWGTEVESFYTVTDDELILPTRITGGGLAELSFYDVQQAARMANYPGAVVGFGGAEWNRYARTIQAGCCTQNGMDLSEIANQFGFAYAYDERLATALGGQNNAIVTTNGAVQWLSFNYAEWADGTPFEIGNNYTKVLVFSPAGVPIDLTMKDDCGKLSITMVAIGKIVTMPDDIYDSTDKYAGVKYLNGLLAVNP